MIFVAMLMLVIGFTALVKGADVFVDGAAALAGKFGIPQLVIGLSEKYYVNSAYLGQLFRKKYGQSFKDYLNNYRMDRAADILLHSDKKIILVAEEVGYHDLDYFVNRFIQVKGCTPAKFRRQMQQ